MTPQKLSLEPFTEGDEWEGIPSITIRTGPTGGPFVAPAIPLASVTMRFKRSGAEPPVEVVELSSATAGQITITSAANWQFSVPSQLVPLLKFGKWKWRIRLRDTSTDGNPRTYLADEIQVLETV